MERPRVSIALGVLMLVAAPLARAAAGPTVVPLPWPTLKDAARTASDRQSFRCVTGEQGIKMKFRGDPASGDTYGYFSLAGDHWIMVRYPSDQTGNPDHIWFGTSPANSASVLTVDRDEAFDPTRHGSPCSEWLLGPTDGEIPANGR